mgnify:CR=1 FL=1
MKLFQSLLTCMFNQLCEKHSIYFSLYQVVSAICTKWSALSVPSGQRYLYQVVSAIGNVKYTDMIRLLEHRKWSPLFESLVPMFKNLRPIL